MDHAQDDRRTDTQSAKANSGDARGIARPRPPLADVTSGPPPRHAAELQRLERVARLLDSRYRIPGTSIRFGLDTVLGLVPGVGDTLTALPSAWLIWRGHRMGVPRRKLARMATNTGVDYVVGSIPVLGDVFDLAFKANNRNIGILRRHLEEEARKTGA